MSTHQSSARINLARAAQGFSLVEITLALGILAFCMIPLLGMIPTGLRAQQNAQESSRATSALNMLATAVRSSQFVSRSNMGATYRLPTYLSNSVSPETNPTTFTVGGGSQTYVYLFLEDGSIRKIGDTTPARQTMFFQIIAPATDAQPVQVYAVVAWPSLPTDQAGTTLNGLKNRQGTVESFITYVPGH